ncbi:MAG: Recombination protein RecR [Candidatus Jorgensenbacteria bacterium GW2011_GWA1_48_11]|uniref:Recombination protein RecR n=1 Tax=Candidatus Jorgensenbacteria bacterium GW2011_GWA1_48_11 TaxID=1618660 RepID=A0A0G1UC59_9BACT|nr:MAG: Recombination protein RecR [Candidatus Jorgensenbacteria bacterium GW2011_GWA1_48_11]KKW12198.1 MAG: Recombination protein RecR [Candidatus Jorgensenbacteria bacterium GW2011_GWB1_49_9]
MIPEQIQKFIDNFSRLPSLGPRLATRLAFYLIGLDKNDLKNLESSLGDLRHLSRCKQCFFLKGGGNLCAICANPKRDKTVIAIVEKETDLISLEKTGQFQGHYLLLGELPGRGSLESSQKLRLEHLKSRIQKELGGKIKEIIIALNPTGAGDFTAQMIKKEFESLAEKITRLGRGIPTGGEIEFADEETLGQALARRN